MDQSIVQCDMKLAFGGNHMGVDFKRYEERLRDAYKNLTICFFSFKRYQYAITDNHVPEY